MPGCGCGGSSWQPETVGEAEPWPGGDAAVEQAARLARGERPPIGPDAPGYYWNGPPPLVAESEPAA